MEEEAAHRKEDDLRDEARLELVVDKALDDRLWVVRGVRGSLTSWELSCECHGVRVPWRAESAIPLTLHTPWRDVSAMG